MILIKEGPTKKVPGITSLFVKFTYNPLLVDVMKSCQGADFDKKNLVWEIPLLNLAYLLDRVVAVDDVELHILKDKKVVKLEYKQTVESSVKLFKHQEEAVQFGLQNPKWLLLDAPGLGKTLSLIRLAEELKQREGIKHCLIICGINTLKSNWKSEIEKFSNLSAVIVGQHIASSGKEYMRSTKERAEQLKNPIDEFFVITNVESLREDSVVTAINKGKNSFDMIVVDEVHCCKSPTSQQGKNLLKVNKSKYQVGATGTLLLNNPMDTYVPLKWIGVEKSTFSNFKYYYCEYGGPFNNVLLGFKNTRQLKDQIEQFSLRRTKDLLDLPPKTIIDEFVEMEPAQNTFYNNIKDGVVEQVDKVRMSTANLLAMVTRLRQATEYPPILTTQHIQSAKLERCIDLAEQILSDPEEKVVIFSVFKEGLTEICERLQQYNPLLCTGDVDEGEIVKARVMFQTDSVHRVMVCTCQKMGTGVTLNRAHYAIFISTPWTEGVQTQCEDRVHRIGTDQKVFIYRLWTKNTIDERVLDLINTKGALSEYIIDDEISEQAMSILRQYIEELK